MPRRNLLGRRTSPTKPLNDTAPSALASEREARLRADNQRLRNERVALTQQLRDTARERDRLELQVRSGATMLAAARRQCAAGCEHAQEASARLVQLAAMQTRLNEYQARKEARDSPAFLERVEVPRQRRRTS